MTPDTNEHPFGEILAIVARGDNCVEEARRLVNAGDIGTAVVKLAEYIDEAGPIFGSDEVGLRFKEILAQTVATCYVMRATGLVAMAQQGHPQAEALVGLAREDAEKMVQFPARWFSDEERTVVAQLAQLFRLRYVPG